MTSILSLSGATAFADSEANGQATNSPGALAGNNAQAPLDVPLNVCGNTADVVAGLNPAFGNECENVLGHRESAPPYGEPPHHGGQHHAEPERKPEQRPHVPQRPHEEPRSHDEHDEEASSTSGAVAEGEAVGSPGAVAGNGAQAPVDAPAQVCGNHAGIASLLSSVFGNGCDAPATEPGKEHEEQEGHEGHEGPEEECEEGESPRDPAPHAPGTGPRIVPPGPVEVTSSTPRAPKHAPQTTREDHPVETRAQLAETGADEMLYGAAAASAALLLGGAILYRRRATSSADE
ncbi:chaplin [Streptomyces sp. NPDC050703]|uniref:chaplin n=1 Tax=Streptomyces sp. NPDC050703 TaxID=3157218 RepID=UPI00344A73A3